MLSAFSDVSFPAQVKREAESSEGELEVGREEAMEEEEEEERAGSPVQEQPQDLSVKKERGGVGGVYVNPWTCDRQL